MKHIAKFNNESDIQTALNNGNLVNPYIASYGNNIDYNQKTLKFENVYLTFTALENMQFAYATHGENQLSYSIDGGETWTVIWPEEDVSLNSGDKIMLKGTLTGESEYGNGVAFFTMQKRFNVEGNVMSIIYGDNFIGQTSLANRQNIFLSLFSNVLNGGYASKVVDASNLVLPATTLTTNCYAYMFMGCTNLTTAPELPATTLATSCYQEMFKGCTGLNYIKCLATNISASNCTSDWVSSVASTGTFVKNSNMSSWSTGDNDIPSGWTIENAA